jgi:hypothetical protein
MTCVIMITPLRDGVTGRPVDDVCCIDYVIEGIKGRVGRQCLCSIWIGRLVNVRR